MYPEVSLLGISYTEYWEMQPIAVMKIAELKKEQTIRELNQQLELAWVSANLQGIAINNPKKFPKKPLKIKSEEEKEKSIMDLAYKLEVMANRSKKD